MSAGLASRVKRCARGTLVQYHACMVRDEGRGDFGRAFSVPYARVVEVRRAEPGRASKGDRARAVLDPGAVGLLGTRLGNEGGVLGAGYQAPLNVPFGLAATAAYAVAGPGQPVGGYWTGRDVAVEWEGEASAADGLEAEAEILDVDEGIVVLHLAAFTSSGRRLLTSTLRLSAVRDGKALPSRLTPPRATPVRRPRVPRPGSRFVAEVAGPPPLWPGESAEVALTLVNTGDDAVDVELRAVLPAGHGLWLPGGDRRQATLGPWSEARVGFAVRADRPHEVNLGRPWPLRVVVAGGGAEEVIEVGVAVDDPEPGRLLYVLTEDCETFDGGPATGDYGERAVLGNCNDFMDPEDYRLQMIDKPNSMNEIAERHGARWTHFFTATQRFAAAWAAGQSTTGAWERLVADLDESVRRGALRHEYAPHLHCDYEPESLLPPQPRLVHDPATDGILPNDYYDPVSNPEHRHHDWDGSARGGPGIKALGDLRTLDSKTGSLYRSLRFLARLQAGHRLPLVARIGSFDFGARPEDQRVSTAAFERCGLLGSSDAYMAWLPPRQGGQLFWCREEDRGAVVEDLGQVRLAQLAVCHDTDFRDPEKDRAWFEQAVNAARGPGVRVVMSMTHAMFMRGEPDPFRSLEGGSFDNLDAFLAWVRERFPEIRFATASEALVEALDYYTPELLALVEPALLSASPAAGRYELPVRLLGRGIAVSAEGPARLRVVVPPFVEPGELAWARLCDGDAVLAQADCFGVECQPGLEVELTGRPQALRLCLQLRPEAAQALAECFATLTGPRFAEPVEEARAPLLRLAPPHDGVYTSDLLRLLMSPAGGHAEPLGRRLHPLGVLAMGICMTEGLAAVGEREPSCPREWRVRRLELRWRKAIPLDATLVASRTAGESGQSAVRVRDQLGDVICDAEVWVAPQPPAPAQECVPAPGPAGEEAAALRAAVCRYAAAHDEALATYRSLRGWRLMLLVQKGYSLLRTGLRPFLGWLWRALRGRAELDTHELQLPRIDDYLE